MFRDSPDLLLDLVPHCASVPRDGWQTDHDLRPLSDTGHQQALALALALAPADGLGARLGARLDARLGARLDAVCTSPALRCRQTVQPLADRVGLPITELPGLHEAVGFAEPTAWVRGTFAPIGEAIGGAWAAGRGAEVMFSLAARHPGGRVVASSHGDIIPATLSFLAAAYACPLPAIVGRGGWYRLRLEHGTLSMTSHTPSPTA